MSLALATLHIHADDVPWVDYRIPGVRSRVLHARPDEDFIVHQLRVQPGSISPLHRHVGPAFGYTTKGAWGHDTNFDYRPGSYIFETPNVAHQFFNGPDETEALFISYIATEGIDPETGEVTGRSSIADMLRHYFQACERAGLGRPNILR